MKDIIFNDDIVEIEYIGVGDTVDIVIDSEDKLFYANDLITHNSGVQETDFDISHIAGGISKLNTADNVMALFAPPSLKEQGEFQIQFIKTRSSSGNGSKINLAYDRESLRITDLTMGEVGETSSVEKEKTISPRIKETDNIPQSTDNKPKSLDKLISSKLSRLNKK